MADEMVLQTQKWLNVTYRNKTGFGSVTEDGYTGWETINALIRALQIELGITQTANNFGPGTQSRFRKRWPNGIHQQADGDKSTDNVYAIIQGALWCKGYSTGSNITTHFYGGTGGAIEELKNDMGLPGDSTVDLEVMKALLSMKQFVLLTRYGGKQSIRYVQQKINRKYRAWTGIIPTDGLYGREMNTALIQVLQKLEGYDPDSATGYFGNGTRSKLKTITASNASTYPEWVWLATSALICNGYGQNPVETWDASITDTVKRFQADYALPVTGVVDPTTWMSLLTSKGDPDRSCVACDTRFEITDELAKHLKADGYKIVGRYLSEPGQAGKAEKDYFKALRTGELERIVGHGLRYFPIFQEYSTKLSHFTTENAHRHAKEAQANAQRLGVPPTVIYFAVDYDATDPEVTSHILPYFQAVKANLQGGYGVGIYASRNICTRVIEAGYAVSAFVSDMSTGFSGNLGFPIPKKWNYDQFTEISGYHSKWDLDRVAYSGAIPTCSVVLKTKTTPLPSSPNSNADSDPLVLWVRKTENECLKVVNSELSVSIGEFILEWLRKPEYWSTGSLAPYLWKAYTPEPPTPAELEVARQMCASICAKQPKIKGTIARRDVAHLAATTLGYLTWGVDIKNNAYGLGDLGGWPLDLLQIWGSYLKNHSSENLTLWLNNHLGSLSSGNGFGYEDVLADADAWFIAKYMKKYRSEHSLSLAMSELYKQNEAERIRNFLLDRFGGSTDNLVQAFSTVSDGLDALGLTNIPGSMRTLKAAAHADQLPNREQAETLARAYGAFLSNPHH